MQNPGQCAMRYNPLLSNQMSVRNSDPGCPYSGIDHDRARVGRIGLIRTAQCEALTRKSSWHASCTTNRVRQDGAGHVQDHAKLASTLLSCRNSPDDRAQSGRCCQQPHREICRRSIWHLDAVSGAALISARTSPSDTANGKANSLLEESCSPRFTRTRKSSTVTFCGVSLL